MEFWFCHGTWEARVSFGYTYDNLRFVLFLFLALSGDFPIDKENIHLIRPMITQSWAQEREVMSKTYTKIDQYVLIGWYMNIFQNFENPHYIHNVSNNPRAKMCWIPSQLPTIPIIIIIIIICAKFLKTIITL